LHSFAACYGDHLDGASGFRVVAHLKDAYGNALDFSKDGRYVAIGWKEIEVWDLLSNTRAHNFPGHNGGFNPKCVNSVQFCKDEKFLLSAGDDGCIKYWSRTDGRLVKSLQTRWVRVHEQENYPLGAIPFAAMKLSPDGEHFVTVTRDGAIHYWDIPTSTPVSALTYPEKFYDSKYGVGRYSNPLVYQRNIKENNRRGGSSPKISFSLSGEKVAVSMVGFTGVWDLKTLEMLNIIDGQHESFLLDEMRLLVLQSDAKHEKVATYDLDSEVMSNPVHFDGRRSPSDYSPGAQLLLSTTPASNKLILWDVNANEVKHECMIPGSADVIFDAVRLSPDGRTIAAYVRGDGVFILREHNLD